MLFPYPPPINDFRGLKQPKAHAEVRKIDLFLRSGSIISHPTTAFVARLFGR
jgi:hypothetical protein